MVTLRCPRCGSTNILPFEDDGIEPHNHPVWIGIAAGILLIGGYFLFMIISYLTFPLIVIAGILISSKFINLRFLKKPADPQKSREYICLDCSQNFRA